MPAHSKGEITLGAPGQDWMETGGAGEILQHGVGCIEERREEQKVREEQTE